MSLFDEYETDLAQLLDSSDGPADERAAQAEELLQAMDIEARSLGAEQRKAARAKIKAGRARVQQLLREALGIGGGGDDGGGAGGAARMASATERMQSQTDTLERATRTVAELEGIGGGIIEQLADNRSTIEHIQGNVRETNATVDQADGVLSRMTRRAKHWWRR